MGVTAPAALNSEAPVTVMPAGSASADPMVAPPSWVHVCEPVVMTPWMLRLVPAVS